MTHLSAEQLADVDAIAGHEHLEVCDGCRQQWQQQRAVRDLLRTLPDPGAIPPDVATGLAEALSRLSPEEVEPPDRALRALRAPRVRPGTAGATVVPVGQAATRRARASRARPWLAAAAAVVVLGGGATALVSHPWSSGGVSDSSTSAGSSPQRQEGAPEMARSAATRVRSTGTDYQREDLPAQVLRELLNGATTGSDTAGASDHEAEAAGGDTRLASPEALASCVSALGLDVGQVTAVDLAEFEGAPAALLVLREADGEQDVWVVGRGCRQGDDQTRYFVRLP
jgi:hypothetical protein